MSSPRSQGSPRGFDPAEEFFESHRVEDQYDDRAQVEETQFADVEIDTQATAGYDLGDAHQPPESAHPELPQMFQPKSFHVTYDDDVNVASGFAFGKAQKKTPAIGIPKKGVEARGPAQEKSTSGPNNEEAGE